MTSSWTRIHQSSYCVQSLWWLFIPASLSPLLNQQQQAGNCLIKIKMEYSPTSQATISSALASWKELYKLQHSPLDFAHWLDFRILFSWSTQCGRRNISVELVHSCLMPKSQMFLLDTQLLGTGHYQTRSGRPQGRLSVHFRPIMKGLLARLHHTSELDIQLLCPQTTLPPCHLPLQILPHFLSSVLTCILPWKRITSLWDHWGHTNSFFSLTTGFWIQVLEFPEAEDSPGWAHFVLGSSFPGCHIWCY